MNPFENNYSLAALVANLPPSPSTSALVNLFGTMTAAETLLGQACFFTPDQYLRGILSRETVDTGFNSPFYQAKAALLPILQAWAHVYLLDVSASGSYSKGTANKSGTDIDLFIALSENTPETLSEIYNKLDRRLGEIGYVTRRQNVSINIKVMGHSVDLVPAKRQNALMGDYSLYRRKADTWTKTNIAIHAQRVRSSGRLEEIRILKLWRDQMRLDFPSFYLELTTIEALGTTLLSALPYGDVANNVMAVFRYLRDNFVDTRVYDPANFNNIVSDDLTKAEKSLIRNKAIEALAAKQWGEIVR